MEMYTIINIGFGWMNSVLCYQKWGMFVPRRTNTDTVEHHFGNSRQSVSGGDVPTAIILRINNARLSTFNATTGPTKVNNVSVPSFNGKRTKHKLHEVNI